MAVAVEVQSMRISTKIKTSLFLIVLLIASCATINNEDLKEPSLSTLVLKISDSNNLETKNVVSFFGDYTVVQPTGFGSIFKWKSKRTTDNYLISEITASNWKGDAEDILRNVNLKIDTLNCYSYENSSRDFGLEQKLLSPPNPHAQYSSELEYYSVKSHAWGSVNYFFNSKQCLMFVRYTANPKLFPVITK